jgi:phosphoglycolate phosphatase
MIKAVIFDFDDTLCLTEEACFNMENEILVEMGRPKMSREIHQATWGKPIIEAIAQRSPGIDQVEFSKRFPEIYERTVKAGKLDVVPEENIRIVKQLADENKYIAILTSRTGAEIAHLKAENHPLGVIVKDFYHKDNTNNFVKPNPRVFDVIFQQGYKPEECVYIGDSISDGAAALGAGMRFIASLESELRTRKDFSEYQVDAFIKDLTELPAVIKKMDAEVKIILASGSPRRKVLMEKLGLPFVINPSSYEEDMTKDLEPKKLVEHLALGKAKDVASRYRDAVVIGADTIIAFEGKVYGKPKDETDARKTLEKFSGKKVEVLTGLGIIDTTDGRSISKSVSSSVWFKELSKTQIEEYIATGEPMDKAGSFTITGHGQTLIDRLEGDFDNILGLPVAELAKELKEWATF